MRDETDKPNDSDNIVRASFMPIMAGSPIDHINDSVPSTSIIPKGENEMAEIDTTQLSQEHGAIRHDIAVESARLGNQIGSEACGINKHIGDSRRESAGETADIRYDVATRAGDIRREVAQEAHALSRQIGDGFCTTDGKVLETGSSIRREGAEHTNEIIKEGLKGDFNTRGDIKDTRFDLASRVGDSTDRIVAHAEGGFDRVVDRVQEHDSKVADRFFTVGRDLMDLRQGQATLAKDVELNALKTQLDAKENTRYIVDKVVDDGEKTRNLINDLKYHDLNRGLVERQTELVNCEQDRRHYRDRWDDARFNQIQAGFQGQWAQLQSQIQAFQSQLQETRQGMVNFGTMAGVGQSSTSNNVR